jgi:hypothetical protein
MSKLKSLSQLPSLYRFLIVLVIFLLFSTFYLLHSTFSYAADAVPKPKVPCGSVKDPEFDSDRPYQASPCGDSPKALFCGNKLVITESIKATRATDFADTMTVDVPVNKTYTVSLQDMQLPILGNTELVKNSQNPEDKIDDATKVNEYVAWYLGGVNNRAEYGDSKNTDTETVNFSGPLQKLLPSTILDLQRIESIQNASKRVPPSTEELGSSSSGSSGSCYPPGRGGCAGAIACAGGVCCPDQDSCDLFLSQNPSADTSSQQFKNLQNATA